MAQQVVIAGAMFEDVPSISVPDANNVYHPFLDTTIASNAAAASDIAQGKLAYVNGSLVTGTNQGGGGGTSIVWGKLRADAVLVKQWTYDKLIHADEGVTIPAYSTSRATLKSGAALASENLDFASYSYLYLARALAVPIYSNTTKSAGRQIYTASSVVRNPIFIPASLFSRDGTTATVNNSTLQYEAAPVLGSFSRIFYCTSATASRIAAASYGVSFTFNSPNIDVSTSSPYSTATFTPMSPDFTIRGSTTYLNSTNWGYMTDIRIQYILELYRIPSSSSVNGWEVESQFHHVLDCANGNGTLT